MSEIVKRCLHCRNNKKVQQTSEEFAEFYADLLFDTVVPSWLKEYFPNITEESYKEDFNNNICPFCKNELVDTLMSIDDVDAIRRYSNNNKELLYAMIELRKKDVIEYELKMKPFRDYVEEQEEKERERKRKLRESKANQPKCPRCGSTNITEGTKGFSLLTGFLGSGDFRYVCKNCGHKWDAKKNR